MTIECGTEKGIVRMNVGAGVPQGSVLGPVLWNIGYNSVLEKNRNDEEEVGCSTICFADDTLIIIRGQSVDEVVDWANGRIEKMLDRIAGLGLTVATEKTEAIVFYKRGCKPKEELIIKVGQDTIRVGDTIKYLGVVLDSRLHFVPHFYYVVEKTKKVMRALGRMMPNLRGPGENRRRLYAFVVASIVLYGASIWCDGILEFPARAAIRQINRVWRNVAIRVISGYRTISFDAATLLAKLPPIALLAEHRRDTYENVKRIRASGAVVTKDDLKRIRSDADASLMEKFKKI